MLEKTLRTIERWLPRSLYRFFQPLYHFLLAFTGALLYRFPSRKLVVIFITGTKGKTSTTEILNNILEESGATTAVLGTLRFKVGDKSERNLRKMTIPGRFFVQKFLRKAVTAGCTHAIIEMTSEGAKQFRHKFIDADALIFTNLSPEHIESHGSYEAYRDAKLSIARALAHSSKPRRLMVANSDDKESVHFLSIANLEAVPYSLKSIEPLMADETRIAFKFKGKEFTSTLGGRFNAYNILGAVTLADKLSIPLDAIVRGVMRTTKIPGRLERVDRGQSFPVMVDYAHTPDSLEAVYQTCTKFDTVCVLGNTGGGRDKWKRPVMGGIAEQYCTDIILTNEDPYDENPEGILREISAGMKSKTPEIILDRRLAIARAITLALKKENSAVLITGKGTDPFIMGPNGTKIPWDDKAVTEEELGKLLAETRT
jgi:UDP-N-acetylmuramoyl-L-alanyl-D-glutamate--2,6-diaminopimelate ligase